MTPSLQPDQPCSLAPYGQEGVYRGMDGPWAVVEVDGKRKKVDASRVLALGQKLAPYQPQATRFGNAYKSMRPSALRSPSDRKRGG